MEFEKTFVIDAPIEKAWAALNTPETVAPCFPGATLTEYEGDTFTGTVKVKLGPISLTYKGTGTYKERDAAAHRVVIDAKGRDSRGNGTAEATVTGTMVADGDARTNVTMVTDMKITGRPAQFGRGVISDVADKIIGQFASCVASKLQAQEAPAAAVEAEPEPVPASVGASSANGAGSNGAAAAPITSTPAAAATVDPKPVDPKPVDLKPVAPKPAAPKPAVAPVGPMKSDIDAIDLLDAAGSPVLKRVAPAGAGVLLLLLIVLLVRRSRAS